MPNLFYRLYRFDQDGHVLDYKAMCCASDDEALQQARPWASCERQELWRGSWLVATIRREDAA